MGSIRGKTFLDKGLSPVPKHILREVKSRYISEEDILGDFHFCEIDVS